MNTSTADKEKVMLLVYQLNPDSSEQLGQPIGYTAEAPVEILTRQAKVIGLTDLVYNTTVDNDGGVGNYPFTAQGTALTATK